MIVVDTNIIAYLVIAGGQTPFAERVFAFDPDWAAPLLWRSEMRNVLSLYLRRSDMTIADVKLVMQQAELIVAEKEFGADSGRVLELADTSGCTAYDCEFIALAERLGVPLITSDKKLVAAFPDIAVPMSAFSE